MVYLPAFAKAAKRVHFLLGCLWEEVGVVECIEEPVPILLRDIGHEPWEALAVEADLRSQTTLNEKVGYRVCT